MASRRGSSFLSNIVCSIAATERQPKEGLVQILDLPLNLRGLDLDSILGLQVPIYDGVHFCHAFFKKRAKANLKSFLQSNYSTSVDPALWQSKPKAKGFAKSKEFSTACPSEVEEDYVMFCNVTEWRLITRLDSAESHSVHFILVVEALEMRTDVHFDVLAERLFNRRFPVFAHHDKEFYDSTRFLVRFLDHACIANGDRNLHADPSVRSVTFKLLNAWKQAGVAVQLTSMDAESGNKRVAPFIWCTTSYVELEPYQSEKELIMQLGKHIYKMAKPKLAGLKRRNENLTEQPSTRNEQMISAEMRPAANRNDTTGKATETGGSKLLPSSSVLEPLETATASPNDGPGVESVTDRIRSNIETSPSSSTAVGSVTTTSLFIAAGSGSRVTSVTTQISTMASSVVTHLTNPTANTFIDIIQPNLSSLSSPRVSLITSSECSPTSSFTPTNATGSVVSVVYTPPVQVTTKISNATNSSATGIGCAQSVASYTTASTSFTPTTSLLLTSTSQFYTAPSNSSATYIQAATTPASTTSPSSVADLSKPLFPSMTIYDEESMNVTMDASAVDNCQMNDGTSIVSPLHDGNKSPASDAENSSDPLSTSIARIVDASNPNDSSFFTADTSPQSTEDRLSTFMSEVDEDSSDAASSSSSIARLSSQEFMSRIARNSKERTSEVEISFDVSHSNPLSTPRPSGEETERLRSISQSSTIANDESQRLSSLAKSALATGEGLSDEFQRLSSVAALNSSFNLGDGENNDEEELNDDSFETISQMELAGVSSFYAIRTKGSPKRSPKRKSSWRGGDVDSGGEGESQSPRGEEKMLQHITPRRPIRDPLKVPSEDCCVENSAEPDDSQIVSPESGKHDSSLIPSDANGSCIEREKSFEPQQGLSGAGDCVESVIGKVGVPESEVAPEKLDVAEPPLSKETMLEIDPKNLEDEQDAQEHVGCNGSPLEEAQQSLPSTDQTPRTEDDDSPVVLDGLMTQEVSNGAEPFYEDSAEDPWGSEIAQNEKASKKKIITQNFNEPAPIKRVTRSKKNKEGNSKNANGSFIELEKSFEPQQGLSGAGDCVESVIGKVGVPESEVAPEKLNVAEPPLAKETTLEIDPKNLEDEQDAQEHVGCDRSPLEEAQQSLPSTDRTPRTKDVSPVILDGLTTQEVSNGAEPFYEDSAEDPWGSEIAQDEKALKKEIITQNFNEPAPIKRVTRSKKNKEGNSKNKEKAANTKRTLRSTGGVRRKGKSDYFDNIAARVKQWKRGEAEINISRKKKKSSRKTVALEDKRDRSSVVEESSLGELEQSTISNSAKTAEPESLFSENDLIIEVKKEIKFENEGDDTDDTKSYEDDDEAKNESLENSLSKSGQIGSGSENLSSSLQTNKDIKPSMSELGGSIQGRESPDGLGSFASTSDPSDSNVTVTLCYFCLSETIFFEGSLDDFRNHLWEHLIEYDDCPLDCELAFEGNERDMASHFFDVHQHLPIVYCPKCSMKFLYDFELLSHTCPSE